MKKHVNFLKKLYRGLAICLCAVGIIGCSGCAQTPPVLQSGIVITPQSPPSYPEEVKTRAKEVVFSILKGYIQRTTVTNLPEKTILKLQTQATEIALRLENVGLSEAEFLEVVCNLENNVEKYVSLFTALKKGEIDEDEKAFFKQVYTQLASKISANALGEIAYELCLYRYDYEYQDKMEDYESKGYEYLKKEAESFLMEKSTLQTSIGRGNFISALNTACIFSELFAGGVFDEESVLSFSNQEILTMIKMPSLDFDGVGQDGWALLLEYAGETFTGNSYEAKLYACALENDKQTLSANAGKMTTLLARVRNKLTIQDVGYIKNGEKGKLLSSMLASFEGVEWALFEELTSLNLSVSKYEQVAKKAYGTAFEEYSESVCKYTLADLKSAVGQENVLEVFEGYLASISPAFSYGVSL